MQESDPFGIGSYMRSRMRELLGNDILVGGMAEPFDVPRFALTEENPLLGPSMGEFYINPEVEWAFPETEVIMPPKGPAQISEKARGHRPIPGIGTEILETTNTRPARSPRRLFRVDVTENDEFYFLRADLAGMTKENVKISVDENQNLISFNVEPPKDDFFGLYKSPLESQLSSKEQESFKGEVGVKEQGAKGEGIKGEEGLKGEGIKSEEGVKEEESKEPEIKEQSVPSTSTIFHKKEVCHLIERSTHPMVRTLKMPKAVDMAKIDAEMREGLLVVKFAKKRVEAEEMKKRSIEIK